MLSRGRKIGGIETEWYALSPSHSKAQLRDFGGDDSEQHHETEVAYLFIHN